MTILRVHESERKMDPVRPIGTDPSPRPSSPTPRATLRLPLCAEIEAMAKLLAWFALRAPAANDTVPAGA